MKREEYLKYRHESNFPTVMLYEYYTNFCERNCISLQEFERYLREGIPRIIGSSALDGKPVWGSVHLNVQRMAEICIEYFDKLFNIVIFTDKQGKLIKYL